MLEGTRRGAAPAHVELASMADPDFGVLLGARLLPATDSLGLNEQELAFLARALGGPCFLFHGVFSFLF